jgi:hypothetical protein
VTHNHHRDDVVDLFRDAFRYFEDLDRHPERALRHVGSPRAIKETESRPAVAEERSAVERAGYTMPRGSKSPS